MKTFKWRLQRLLDIREKQDEALRAELAALTEQTAALRGRILMEKAMLRNRLAELRGADGASRIAQQQMFMQYVAAVDAQIAGLQRELEAVEQQRKEKMEAMMAVRKLRTSLERLRAQAVAAHHQQAEHAEQNEQDENANAAFARKMRVQRTETVLMTER